MTYKPPAPRPEPEPKPGVEVGDELYIHHKGQPCTGKVKAHGRHGVTVDVAGEHAQVKWDKVLGHKKRALQRYSIMDQGEDGMLVQDGTGRRRFIATPNESKEDPMVAKSFTRPVMLFMKAAPATGAPPGPGLQKKQITDKNGVQTTKWVSTDKGGPPAQRGQHVGFENGAHRGHGEVTASGQHGVTVKDDAGGEHRVHHEKVTHTWGGDGKPDASPHEGPGKPEDGTPGAVKPTGALFSPDEVASLPDKVNQPVKTWDELVTKGNEALGQFRERLGQVAQSMGLQSGKKPDELTPEDWESDKGFLFLAPLKGEARAKEKVESDYDGDWSQLRDIVRATISVPSMGNVGQVLQHLKSVGIELAQKPKDRFAKPTDEGYRDLMTIVRLPNGMLAELQIHVKAMTLAKEEGHAHYNVTRGLQAKYGDPAPTDKWDDGDKKKFADALAAQKQIYDTVWTKASGAGADAGKQQPEEKPMQKAENSSKMIMLFRKTS